MSITSWPYERPVLVATSYPADALLLRVSLDRVGFPIAVVNDGVTAMHALCGRQHQFAGVVVSDRVGRVSGLTLCGLARDAGCALPMLLLTAEDCRVIAARTARLRVAVLWQPVTPRRLESALRAMLPRKQCMAS